MTGTDFKVIYFCHRFHGHSDKQGFGKGYEVGVAYSGPLASEGGVTRVLFSGSHTLSAFLEPSLVCTTSFGLANTLRFPPLVISQGFEVTSESQVALAF